MKISTFTLAVASLAASLNLPARAEDGPPKLNIEKTCASPGRTELQVQTSQKDGEDGCLRSERAAHDELKKRWREFSPEAKNQCSKQSQAGGFPSYVETVTCLELASGTAPAQTNGGNPNKASKPDRDSLTAEPSPLQRTDPIKTLEKQ